MFFAEEVRGEKGENVDFGFGGVFHEGEELDPYHSLAQELFLHGRIFP